MQADTTTLLSFPLKEKKLSSSWQRSEVKSIILEWMKEQLNCVLMRQSSKDRKPDDLREKGQNCRVQVLTGPAEPQTGMRLVRVQRQERPKVY